MKAPVFFWRQAKKGCEEVWSKTVTQIHSSILHLGSQRAFTAVLRTRTRMAGRAQTASDAPSYRAGGTRRHVPSLILHKCFFKQNNLRVRDFSNFSDPWEEHFGPACLGDRDCGSQTPAPLLPCCTDKPLRLLPHHPPNQACQPPPHPLEPSLSDLWCTETQFTLQKALIRPWKAIKRELHMSVKGFAPQADVLLADAPPTSHSGELCSTSETRRGERQPRSWAARLVFMRPSPEIRSMVRRGDLPLRLLVWIMELAASGMN